DGRTGGIQAVDLGQRRSRRAVQSAEAMPAIPEEGSRHAAVRAEDRDETAERVEAPGDGRRTDAGAPAGSVVVDRAGTSFLAPAERAPVIGAQDVAQPEGPSDDCEVGAGIAVVPIAATVSTGIPAGDHPAFVVVADFDSIDMDQPAQAVPGVPLAPACSSSPHPS